MQHGWLWAPRSGEFVSSERYANSSAISWIVVSDLGSESMVISGVTDGCMYIVYTIVKHQKNFTKVWCRLSECSSGKGRNTGKPANSADILAKSCLTHIQKIIPNGMTTQHYSTYCGVLIKSDLISLTKYSTWSIESVLVSKSKQWPDSVHL